MSRNDSIIRAGSVAASLLVLAIVAVAVIVLALLVGFIVGPWLSLLVVVFGAVLTLRWWRGRTVRR
jgi:hypothetical protein